MGTNLEDLPRIFRTFSLYWHTFHHMYIAFLCQIFFHWGRVTHICVGKLTIIGSDNGLSSEQHQAIICTNGGVLLIGPLGINFSEILIVIQTFSLKKLRLKLSSAKCCSFRLSLNELMLCCKQYCVKMKPVIMRFSCSEMMDQGLQ